MQKTLSSVQGRANIRLADDNRWHRLMVGVAMFAVILALSTDTAKPAEMQVVVAEWTTISQERSFDGVVEAQRRSTVSSQVAARIEELPFDVDDFVERGDVIVRFRNLPAAAELKQAEAAEQEARARLEEAKSSHDRIRKLYDQQRVSKADLDRATADLQSAEARVIAAEGAVSGALDRYENTVVRAPYSGIVVARHVELGEMATVGMPLMTGLSLEHLRVVVDVPQSDIGALRKDSAARIELPDGEILRAVETRIFPNADPATHTFRVRLRLEEGQHGIYPGMWVKVQFQTGKEQALLIPVSALITRSELVAVYVLDDTGTPRLRQVRPGRALGDGRVVVSAGLEAGEFVVTDPEAARLALSNGGPQAVP